MKNCYSLAAIDPPVAAALPADVAATVVPELPLVTPAVDAAIVDDAIAPVPTAAVLAERRKSIS